MKNRQLLIPGPAGQLEALLSEPDDLQAHPAMAVICHPHPLYSGSMQNKVVHILASTFGKQGLPTLRFNFRGVGQSAGEYDEGRGEQADLAAAVGWMREHYPGRPLWLAGFSFGAWVAYMAHREVQAERLLLVAPPLRLFEFSETSGPVTLPWLVIQGAEDEIVSAEAVAQWVESQPRRPEFHLMAGASHFFHGKLNELRDVVVESWFAPSASKK